MKLLASNSFASVNKVSNIDIEYYKDSLISAETAFSSIIHTKMNNSHFLVHDGAMVPQFSSTDGNQTFSDNGAVADDTNLKLQIMDEALEYVFSTNRFLINGIGLMLLCIVGMKLNTIVAVIFSLKCMRIGVNAFLACLAISDSVYLLTLMLNQSLVTIYRYFIDVHRPPVWLVYVRLVSDRRNSNLAHSIARKPIFGFHASLKASSDKELLHNK